jgi:uncharacterized oligopeptide transporter (OPT) family protein
VFRLSTGFSLALLGAGYLIGLASGLAMLLGAVMSWGVLGADPDSAASGAGGRGDRGLRDRVYGRTKVRFIGAGVIGVAAIWALAALAGPTIAGVRAALAAVDLSRRPSGPHRAGFGAALAMGVLFGLSVVAMAVCSRRSRPDRRRWRRTAR